MIQELLLLTLDGCHYQTMSLMFSGDIPRCRGKEVFLWITYWGSLLALVVQNPLCLWEWAFSHEVQQSITQQNTWSFTFLSNNESHQVAAFGACDLIPLSTASSATENPIWMSKMQWTYFVIPKPSNKDRLKDFLQHLILHYSPCKLIPHCFRGWIIVSYIYITFSRFLQPVRSLNQTWTKYVFKHNISFTPVTLTDLNSST